MLATCSTGDDLLDARELRWAAEEVGALLRRCDPGSIVHTVLRQTLSELDSLKRSLEGNSLSPVPMPVAA